MYSLLAKPEQALVLYDQALTLTRTLGDRRHEAELLWLRAIHFADLGQRDDVIASGQAAVDLLNQLKNPNASWFAANLARYLAGEASNALRDPGSPAGMAFSQPMVIGAGVSPSPSRGAPDQVQGPSLLRM